MEHIEYVKELRKLQDTQTAITDQIHMMAQDGMRLDDPRVIKAHERLKNHLNTLNKFILDNLPTGQ